MTTPRTAATPDSHKDSISELTVHHGRLNLSETWQLIRPYWFSDDRHKAWGLLALVIGLNLFLVYMNVLFTDWNRLFYNALEQKNYGEFWAQLLRFSWIAALLIIGSIMRLYYSMMLQMRWRTWITGSFLDDWLGKQAFYRLEQTRSADNPDQRIADDLRTFTDATLTLALGFLNSAVTLVSFFGILWAVSGPLAFSLGGHDFVIPGYMVWFALLYSIVGSVIIHFVGRPLIGLSFQQERYEAYFRFLLVRVRENSESIALYRGEPTEKAILSGRFERIRTNWNQLMDYTRRLTFASSGYAQFAIIFPFLVSAPRYFGGTLTLGGMMQVATAFGQVQDAMSWFVTNYRTLVTGMGKLGFKPFLDPAIQAPIIVTFHAPADNRYDFKAFYAAARNRGFVLYPGKLTQVETFRVGCIGAIGPNEMAQAVQAVAGALQDMGIRSAAPAG